MSEPENKGALSGISDEDLARLKAEMLLEMNKKPSSPSEPKPKKKPKIASSKPEEGEKPKKKKSKARVIIEWVGLIFVGGLFLFVLSGQIESMINKQKYYGQPIRFGWGSFVVQTDSMEPDYPVDSAIVTYREEPESIYARFIAGDTIDITFIDGYQQDNEYAYPTDEEKTTFVTKTSPTGIPMTHRLRAIHVNESAEVGKGRYYFFVSGINTQGNLSRQGQYQVFPDYFILGVVRFNSPVLGGFYRFIASPWGLFGLLLVPAVYLVVVSVIDIFKAIKEPEEEPAGGPSLSDADKERLKQQMLAEMMRQKALERRQGTPAPAAKPIEEKPEPAAEEPKPQESAAEEAKPEEPAPAPAKPSPLGGLSEEDIARLKAEMLLEMRKKKGNGK